MDEMVEKHRQVQPLLQTLIAIAGLLVCAPTSSYANCSGPIGTEGSQIYNSTENVMQFCDGADWISMDGSVVVKPRPDDLGNHTAIKNLDMGGFKVINLGTPSDPGDAVTKAYVDARTGTSEADPKVGTLTNGKWCKSDAAGEKIVCTSDPPAISATPRGICVAIQTIPTAGNGGTAVSAAWTKRSMTNITCEGLTGVTLSSGSISLPVGRYYIDAYSAFYGIAKYARARIVKNTSTPVIDGTTIYMLAVTGHSRASGYVNMEAPGTIDLQYYYGTTNSGNNDLGIGVGAGDDIVSTIYIKKISSTPEP